MKDDRRRRFIAFFEKRYRGDRARLINDTGLTKGRIAQLFDPKEPFGEVAARRLAEALGLPSDFFEVDQASQRGPAAAGLPPDSARVTNVEPGPDMRGKVPVISWVQAGQWADSCDVLELGDVERWLLCPVAHSHCTAALRVRGDSMTAPLGAARTYPDGCYIFVDFEKRSPVNGQRIIARLADSTEVTFKVFRDEDSRRWLMPLNPMYPPLFEKFEPLGTVIGKWEDE